MATYVKINLSASTDNMPIEITDSATIGQTIHTAHATSLDEIYLWANNVHASESGNITIEMGQAASKFTYFNVEPNKGLIVVVPGIHLTGSKLCTVFADATGKFIVSGYIIRYTA
jgi:hypothetical protein